MSEEYDKLFQNLVRYIEEANERQTSVLKADVAELKSEIKTEIADIKNILTEESNKRKELEIRQNQIEERIARIEKLARKNNIVIFGLQPREENLLSYTIEQLNQHLNVNINALHINNLFSLGKNQNNPPVLVQFTSFLTKLEVLKQSKNLKGTGIHISEELSKEERENRKVLVKHQKQARGKNLNAYIRNNKLIINHEAFTAEELENIESDWEEENFQEDLNEIEIHTKAKKVNKPLATSVSAEGNNKEEKDEYEDEIENTKVTKKRRIAKTFSYTLKSPTKPITRNTANKKKINNANYSPKKSSPEKTNTPGSKK